MTDDDETRRIFRFLTHDEFARLTKTEKIEYLARAIRAVTRNAAIVSVVPNDWTPDQTPGRKPSDGGH